MKSEVAVLELVGDIDRGALAAVADLCGDAARGEVGHVVLDLSKVDHLDYAGVPSLVARRRKLKARGVGLVLVGGSKYLQQIVRIGGGADIECARTLQEALDSIVCAQVSVGAHGRKAG